MYFNIPKSQDRHHSSMLNKKPSNSSLDSTTAIMTDDRISEIIHNLDDHWGSPPILTPNTLSHILNHQWTSDEVKEDDIKKVSKAAAVATVAANRVINYNNKLITILIEEFCKTIQCIDSNNEYEITKDIKTDPVIQKFIAGREEGHVLGRDENVMEYFISLLRHHNSNEQNKP